MVEQSPNHSLQSNWRESVHLNFAQKPLSTEGDPEMPEAFSRALHYLESITAHFQEFGPLEEKTSIDLGHELSYHNSWHEYEVEQARQAGDQTATYQEISLHQLRALSRRCLLAMTEAGQKDEASLFVAQLIEQAIAEEEALDRVMTPATVEP